MNYSNYICLSSCINKIAHRLIRIVSVSEINSLLIEFFGYNDFKVVAISRLVLKMKVIKFRGHDVKLLNILRLF